MGRRGGDEVSIETNDVLSGSVTMADPRAQFAAERRHHKTMLAPAAYSETVLPSLRLARSSRMARVIGKSMLALLVLTFFLVAFAPWQQSVVGSGDVMAYAPGDRQQTIEAPIKGRIVNWGSGIVEKAHVRKGDLIVEIADIDESYLSRLESQLAAGRSQVEAQHQLLEASQRNLAAALTVVVSIESQVAAYRTVKEQVIASANAEIESAKNKVTAEQQHLAEQRAVLAQVEADYERQKTLFAEGITSTSKFQDAERKYREATAKVAKAEAYVAAARNDLEAKLQDRDAKANKAQVDIDYAIAALQKSQGDVAKVEGEIAKASSDLNKAKKELLDQESKLARQRSQTVVAPFDGFLTKIMANQGSRVLKEGDPLCVIVPDTADRAVQIWLRGNDAPLVTPGRHVRLQFEGWPAVQFAGWPSVAVGTFGGEIISVDATDDGKGKFRALVLPDENSQGWPDERYLRQGVRANGWVLLDQVPLWYEIWRRTNGFPPIVSQDEGGQGEKGAKLPKLPKP